MSLSNPEPGDIFWVKLTDAEMNPSGQRKKVEDKERPIVVIGDRIPNTNKYLVYLCYSNGRYAKNPPANSMVIEKDDDDDNSPFEKKTVIVFDKYTLEKERFYEKTPNSKLSDNDLKRFIINLGIYK